MVRVGCLAFVGLFFIGSSIARADLSYQPEAVNELRFVTVSGEFTSHDELSEFVRVVRASGATFVTFNSSGGSIYKAMELGRAIRALDLATLQLRKHGECASACSLAFMGAHPGWRTLARSASIDRRLARQ